MISFIHKRCNRNMTDVFANIFKNQKATLPKGWPLANLAHQSVETRAKLAIQAQDLENDRRGL